ISQILGYVELLHRFLDRLGFVCCKHLTEILGWRGFDQADAPPNLVVAWLRFFGFGHTDALSIRWPRTDARWEPHRKSIAADTYLLPHTAARPHMNRRPIASASSVNETAANP